MKITGVHRRSTRQLAADASQTAPTDFGADAPPPPGSVPAVGSPDPERTPHLFRKTGAASTTNDSLS